MTGSRHHVVAMTADDVETVRGGEAVEVFPDTAESRTVVPWGWSRGPVDGHYRFCFLQTQHLDKLAAGGEVVVESYDDLYHLTVTDLP